MAERTLAAALSFLLAASVVAAQPPAAPARDNRAAPVAAPTGNASISGTVLVAGSAAPARRARVTLSGGEMRGSLTRTTDDQGRFAFTGLPAGRYSLGASKPGHVSVTYGQHRPGPGRQGTAIQLADGQQFQARLQMPRGGAITGAVLDEHAEATPGIQVRAMRIALQGGQRALQAAGGGATDDRGIYRIYGLQPGDYVVCATPRGTVGFDMERLQIELEAVRRSAESAAQRDAAGARAMQERAAFLQSQMTDETQATGFAPVCFPGSATPAGASPIALAAGEERTAVDFQLQLVPLARIEGTVVSSGGAPLQNVQVTLVNAGDLAAVENRTARADAEGRFRLSSVPPGQYTLMARGAVRAAGESRRAPQTVADKVSAAVQGRAGPDDARLWSTMEVSIDGRNLTNVVLSLQPGVTVSGQVAFDGSTQPPTELARARVTLLPANPAALRGVASSATGRVDATGRFTIPGVTPGRYRVSASSGASGWSVESAVIGGQDAADFPVEIRANQNLTSASITFTDRQTEFAGAVVNERNEPVSDYTVVVYAADQRYWNGQSRRIQAARPGTDGRFTFRGLPPGDYRLATVFDPEPGSWTDPAFLQQLEDSSTAFALAAGEKKVQNVRVSHPR